MSKPIKPIRIHHGDDDEQAHARHAEIQTRLNDLGPQQVALMLATGGLPTGWNPIIHAWMSGERLEEAA